MNKLKALEKEIDEGLALIGLTEKVVHRANDKLNALKKEQQDRPAFPNRENWDGEIWRINNGEAIFSSTKLNHGWIKRLSELGLTFYSKAEAEKELERMEERACAIESAKYFGHYNND